MTAPHPSLSPEMGAFPQLQAPLHGHFQRNELQSHFSQARAGRASMTTTTTTTPINHGQPPHPYTYPFLRPSPAYPTSANSFRNQNCSSQNSMRSGASSVSFPDADPFLTPGTSQEGLPDTANHPFSSFFVSCPFGSPRSWENRFHSNGMFGSDQRVGSLLDGMHSLG